MLKLAAVVMIISAGFSAVRAQSVTSPSQAQKDEPPAEYRLILNRELPVELPKTPGAWVLEIEVTEGFFGESTRHMFLTSDGNLLNNDLDGGFHTKVSDGFPELDKLCQSIDRAWFKRAIPALISLCSDCYRTTLRIYRFEGAANVEYGVTWDDTSQARVAEPVLNIYRVASQIAQTASAKRNNENPARPKQ